MRLILTCIVGGNVVEKVEVILDSQLTITMLAHGAWTILSLVFDSGKFSLAMSDIHYCLGFNNINCGVKYLCFILKFSFHN